MAGSINTILGAVALLSLLGCSGGSGSFGGGSGASNDARVTPGQNAEGERETIFDLLDRPDRNTDYRVNRFLWNASLDVLNFLPIESADPFSGIIQFGYGRAPGGSTSYRATVRISEAALEGRALKLALQTRNGDASAETKRQVEDAILTRARQLRIQDGLL